MIEITNKKGNTDAFIKKLIATIKEVEYNGIIPLNRYALTGLKLDVENNLVTLYGGFISDPFPQHTAVHLENGELVYGEDKTFNLKKERIKELEETINKAQEQIKKIKEQD